MQSDEKIAIQSEAVIGEISSQKRFRKCVALLLILVCAGEFDVLELLAVL